MTNPNDPNEPELPPGYQRIEILSGPNPDGLRHQAALAQSLDDDGRRATLQHIDAENAQKALAAEAAEAAKPSTPTEG